MKIFLFLTMVLPLTIFRACSQTVTYEMAKITVDSIMNCDLVPTQKTLIAIDVSQINMTKDDHKRLIKYVKKKYPRTKEMTYDDYLKIDKPVIINQHLKSCHISLADSGFIVFRPDPEELKIKRIFFYKLYGKSDGFNGWTEFYNVEDKYIFKGFTIFDFY